MENTQNNRSLPPATLREMMGDVKRRLQARNAAQEAKEAAEAAAFEAMTGVRRAPKNRNPTTVLPGQSLRETEDQLFRVFQLFDPRNTKSVPLGEVLMLLRAVAIDVDEAILQAIMQQAFPDAVQREIKTAGRITCEQFVQLVKHAGAGSGSKQEARRVFEAVLPGQGTNPSAAITFDAFKTALRAADARITDSELSEIFRYCALSGNPGGLTLRDFEQVSEFVSDFF